MSATQLTVFNDALGMCGQPPLESPDDPGEDGRILRSHWTAVVEYCHEKTAWDFAKLRVKLARSGTTPAFGYDYYYTLPADLLRILFLSETGLPTDKLNYYEGEPGKIATNAADVYCVYVSDQSVTQVGRWSQAFAHYVAASLALRAAPKLNPAAVDDIKKEQKQALSDAVGIDAAQGPVQERRPGSWSRAARGNYVRISKEQGV